MTDSSTESTNTPSAAVDEGDAPAAGATQSTARQSAAVETTSASGQSVWHCTVEQYLPLIQSLHDDGYRFCVDVCATDSLTNSHRQLPESIPAERYEIVVNLLDMPALRRTRVRAQVTGDDPSIPTITHLFPGAEAPEREAADLFGIVFEGHPDPSRILLPEDWEGHPLRKDYDIGAIPVQFKAVPGR